MVSGDERGLVVSAGYVINVEVLIKPVKPKNIISVSENPINIRIIVWGSAGELKVCGQKAKYEATTTRAFRNLRSIFTRRIFFLALAEILFCLDVIHLT